MGPGWLLLSPIKGTGVSPPSLPKYPDNTQSVQMPLLSWVLGAQEVLRSRLCRWPESMQALLQAVCTSRRLLYALPPARS